MLAARQLGVALVFGAAALVVLLALTLVAAPPAPSFSKTSTRDTTLVINKASVHSAVADAAALPVGMWSETEEQMELQSTQKTGEQANHKADGSTFSPTDIFKASADTAEMMLPGVVARTAVKYGLDSASQVLNFWQAPGKGLRPLVVHIHGGGWVDGDYRESKPHGFLAKGISYASVEYRNLREAPLPAPVHDLARAIQFLRHKAAEYNIDTSKIILKGQSAGGCSALYINYHDDLADPDSADPIARESTRVAGTIVKSAQSSIDPAVISKWGMGADIVHHEMVQDSVGFIDPTTGLTEKQQALYKEFSPINHVDADDPPVFLTVSGDDTLPCPKICIHHPVFGVRLKAAADVAGATTFLEHEVYKEGADRRARNSATYIERPTSGDGRNVKYKSAMGFIFDHVGMDAGGKPKPVAI